MEVLYRVYVGAIFAAIGLGVLGGAIHEAPADASALDSIRVHAPPIIGIALALGLLAGCAAGSHGGPLAIEPAEVQYTLLAPLDRGVALRPAAFAQLRIAAIAGAVTGAVVGNFVFRRFPGSPVEWIASLALFGALVPVCALGGALLASGRRLRPLLAGGIGVVLALWSVADLVFGWTTSPATMLGELATLPLQHGARIALAGAGAPAGSGADRLRAAWDRGHPARGGAPPRRAGRRAALHRGGRRPAHGDPPAPPARLGAAAAAALAACRLGRPPPGMAARLAELHALAARSCWSRAPARRGRRGARGRRLEGEHRPLRPPRRPPLRRRARPDRAPRPGVRPSVPFRAAAARTPRGSIAATWRRRRSRSRSSSWSRR